MDNPSEFNYTTEANCDSCGETREGMMYHANDANGWATPVLFECTVCANPPLTKRIARRLRRAWVLTKYWVRLALRPEARASRARMKEKMEAIRARRQTC